MFSGRELLPEKKSRKRANAAAESYSQRRSQEREQRQKRKKEKKKENSKCEPSYKVISVHIQEQKYSDREQRPEKK